MTGVFCVERAGKQKPSRFVGAGDLGIKSTCGARARWICRKRSVNRRAQSIHLSVGYNGDAKYLYCQRQAIKKGSRKWAHFYWWYICWESNTLLAPPVVGGAGRVGVKAAESRGATPLGSTKTKSDEHLLFQRRICRKGVDLRIKFNTISFEVVFLCLETVTKQ